MFLLLRFSHYNNLSSDLVLVFIQVFFLAFGKSIILMEAITFFFFLFFHVGGKTVSRGVPISLVAKSHLLIDQIMRYILQTFNITPLAKVQTLPTVHTFTTPAVR